LDKARKTEGEGTAFQLKEDQIPNNADFNTENADLSAENAHFWNDIE
jgi:hypothetical protein